MTGIQNLEIDVIYSEDRRTLAGAQRTSAVNAAGPSRVVGCAALLAAAVWLFAVWFPVDDYLYKCLVLKTPLPGNLDLGALFFGGAPAGAGSMDFSQLLFRGPPPADLAHPAPPSDEAPGEPPRDSAEDGSVSAYRSPAKTDEPAAAGEITSDRSRLPHVVYSWLGFMTIAGLALAMVGGAGVANWLTGPLEIRLVRLAAGAALLAALLITFQYWPRGGDYPKMPQEWQHRFVAVFLVLAWSASATVTRSQALRVFFFGAAIVGLLAWVISGREGGVQFIGPRAGVMCGMVLAAVLGAAFSHRAKGLNALALILVAVTIAATMAGLAYGSRIEGFVDFAPTSLTYLKAGALLAAAGLPLLLDRMTAR